MHPELKRVGSTEAHILLGSSASYNPLMDRLLRTVLSLEKDRDHTFDALLQADEARGTATQQRDHLAEALSAVLALWRAKLGPCRFGTPDGCVAHGYSDLAGEPCPVGNALRAAERALSQAGV